MRGAIVCTAPAKPTIGRTHLHRQPLCKHICRHSSTRKSLTVEPFLISATWTSRSKCARFQAPSVTPLPSAKLQVLDPSQIWTVPEATLYVSSDKQFSRINTPTTPTSLQSHLNVHDLSAHMDMSFSDAMALCPDKPQMKNINACRLVM